MTVMAQRDTRAPGRHTCPRRSSSVGPFAERSGGARPRGRLGYGPGVSIAQRERLSPETFRLPLDKIRSGYYSDAYFNHAKTLLEDRGLHPRVLMQVFQRKASILGGVDEAI